MQKHIVILGAGISGLSLAWFLKKAHGNSIKITILEKSHRAGGWIQTMHKDNFLFELGPHSFRSKGNSRAMLELLEELSLAEKVIVPSPEAKKRYLYYQQRLQQLPSNLASFLFSPLTRGCLSGLLSEIRKPCSGLDDESIDAFVRRRFNAHTATVLMDPLISGIYAGDTNKLSMRACFPEIFAYEQHYGSILKGLFYHKKKKESISSPFVQNVQKHGLFSLQEGMGALITRLTAIFEEDIVFDTTPHSLHVQGDRITIRANDLNITADHVYSTIPAYALGELLQSIHPTLASSLKFIEYASIAKVNLGFSQPVLKHKGFGYLIPSKEKEKILGVIWDSAVFPGQNAHDSQTRLTVMMGGARFPDMISLKDEKLLSIALKSVCKHIGISQKPTAFHISRIQRAIPQFHVGYFRTIDGIKAELARLSSKITCTGMAFSGISINDCIAYAKSAAAKFVL